MHKAWPCVIVISGVFLSVQKDAELPVWVGLNAQGLGLQWVCVSQTLRVVWLLTVMQETLVTVCLTVWTREQAAQALCSWDCRQPGQWQGWFTASTMRWGGAGFSAQLGPVCACVCVCL